MAKVGVRHLGRERENVYLELRVCAVRLIIIIIVILDERRSPIQEIRSPRDGDPAVDRRDGRVALVANVAVLVTADAHLWGGRESG